MAEKNLDEKLVPLPLLKSPNVNSPEQIVYTEFYNLVKANLRLKSPPVGHREPYRHEKSHKPNFKKRQNN